MALCPVWVKKTVKCRENIWDPVTKSKTGEQIVPKQKTLICGRKPEFFLRAFYKELHHYRQGEGKYDDLFGLCSEHGPKYAADVSIWSKSEHDWRGERALSGLRGLVERVEMVPMDQAGLEAMAKEDRSLRLMASVKSEFKRKMSQRSTEKLTVDHWRQVFEECLNEWVTEQVMES